MPSKMAEWNFQKLECEYESYLKQWLEKKYRHPRHIQKDIHSSKTADS